MHRLRIVSGINAPEKVVGRICSQRNVFTSQLSECRFAPFQKLTSDALPPVSPIHKEHIDPAPLRFQPPLQIRELPLCGKHKPDNCFPVQGHPAQARIEVLIQNRLPAEFADVNGVKDTASIPKINYLRLIALRVVANIH